MAQQNQQNQESGSGNSPGSGNTATAASSLAGKSPAETYKDLLTVASATNNQGLEPTAKRVFDGEGIGSPLFLGTNSLDIVGTSTITGDTSITGDVAITGTTTMTGDATVTGDLTVTGTIINDGMGGDGTFTSGVTATSFALSNPSTGATTNAFSLAGDGTVQVTANLVTKGAMTFMGSGGEEVRVDAAGGGVQKGDGTKGKVAMKETEVSLNKGEKELFTAKEDGTTRMQTVDTLPADPSPGDIVNKDGELMIATDGGGDDSNK